jgi:hypothetical protein
MIAALPWVLTILAGAMLVLAVVALWQSLRAAFGVASVEQARGASVSEERADLFDEKAALLRSIRDLELDRESGKISDADFERLDGRLRSRAREVLRALDRDVEPHRPAARALVAEALGTPAATAGEGDLVATSEPAPSGEGDLVATSEPAPTGEGDPAAPPQPAPTGEGDPAAPAERPECPQCGATNDADAVFCKRCGARMGEGAR